jgi:hypothetical protein
LSNPSRMRSPTRRVSFTRGSYATRRDCYCPSSRRPRQTP